MKQQIEKVKKHFGDHKELYLGIGIGVVVTAVVVVVTVVSRGDSGAQMVQKVLAFKTGDVTQSNPVIINLIERSTPSRPVHLVGTNLFFSSMSEAARETGHSLGQISRNVNGHTPDVHGDVFQLLEAAA